MPRQKQTMRPAPAATPEPVKPPCDEQGLSLEERAIVSRLIRVLRTPTYWLGPFIEWMLQKDAGMLGPLDREECKKMIGTLDAFLDWNGWFQHNPVERAPIIRYVGSLYFPGRFAGMDVVPPNEDDQFYELARIWRAEHPAPKKKQLQPAGLLGRPDEDEADEDED